MNASTLAITFLAGCLTLPASAQFVTNFDTATPGTTLPTGFLETNVTAGTQPSADSSIAADTTAPVTVNVLTCVIWEVRT